MFDHLSKDFGTPIEIAIVEGDPVMGENLRQSVESIPDTRCIGVWNSAASGLKKIDAFRPTVVLMDIDLPDMSGIKATALLKRFLPEIHVIILSTGDDHERVVEALKAGARGFLLKPETFGRSQPANAPQCGLMLGAIARRATEALHRSPARTSRNDAAAVLSAREIEVARLIADGLTNKEIGSQL